VDGLIANNTIILRNICRAERRSVHRWHPALRECSRETYLSLSLSKPRKILRSRFRSGDAHLAHKRNQPQLAICVPNNCQNKKQTNHHTPTPVIRSGGGVFWCVAPLVAAECRGKKSKRLAGIGRGRHGLVRGHPGRSSRRFLRSQPPRLHRPQRTGRLGSDRSVFLVSIVPGPRSGTPGAPL